MSKTDDAIFQELAEAVEPELCDLCGIYELEYIIDTRSSTGSSVSMGTCDVCARLYFEWRASHKLSPVLDGMLMSIEESRLFSFGYVVGKVHKNHANKCKQNHRVVDVSEDGPADQGDVFCTYCGFAFFGLSATAGEIDMTVFQKNLYQALGVV